MNIFVLDKCPIKAAQMQCDKHVVKMCVETVQLLCNIFYDYKQYLEEVKKTKLTNNEIDYRTKKAPYWPSHYNHLCAKWTRESWANYYWLYKHGIALCAEYQYRYGKEHQCLKTITWCWENISNKFHLFSRVDEHDPINFVKCMPDQHKVNDIVQSYRNYYKGAKKDIAKWTKRPIPDWWIE